jgi:excisionase family DNA binding protein
MALGARRGRILLNNIYLFLVISTYYGYNYFMKVAISEAARILGVSISTLRRWDEEGRFPAERTPAGHRRYDLNQLKRQAVHRLPDAPEEANRMTIGYARVSSHDQKADLNRQVLLLSEFCTRNGWEHDIIDDLGSGLNYRKRGLRQLIKRICSGQVKRLVLSHKDRLLRFGSELVFTLCEEFGTEVVIINQAEPDIRFEEELAQDVLEIITVFSARLYGRRSHQNRKLMAQLQEAAQEL